MVPGFGQVVPTFADFDSRLFLEHWPPIHCCHGAP